MEYRPSTCEIIFNAGRRGSKGYRLRAFRSMLCATEGSMERRVAVRKPIICRMDCATQHQTFTADGFDMSETGVSFKTDVVLPQNAEVTLHYRLQEDGPMVTARVLICQQSGGRYGAKFLDRKVALATGS